MRTRSATVFLFSVTALLAFGCSEDAGPADGSLTIGTLVFHTQIGSGAKAIRHCRLVDLRAQLHRFSVSGGEIRAGETDTLEWHDVYVGTGADVLMSEVNIELALPVGTYSNYKFTWGNPMAWILDCDTETIELPGYMQGPDYSGPPRATVNNMGGCWGYDEEGRFYTASHK